MWVSRIINFKQVNNSHIGDVELFDWLVFNACMMWRYFIGLFLIDVADSTQPGMQSPDPFPCGKLSLYAQDEKTRVWLHRLLSILKGKEVSICSTLSGGRGGEFSLHEETDQTKQ